MLDDCWTTPTGFELESVEDVCARTLNFWSATIALMRAEADQMPASARSQLDQSLRVHRSMQMVFKGALRHLLQGFVKDQSTAPPVAATHSN